MSDPNEWPDPERPGVPENPDREGWHWLQNRKAGRAPYPVLWKAEKGWVWSAIPYFPTADTAFRYRYLGPCHTPAERAALAAELDQAVWCMGEANADRDRLAAERDALRAEVAAREAAAAEAMREACAKTAFSVAQISEAGFAARDLIRALPLPAPDTLARVRAEAMREGMEQAAAYLNERKAVYEARTIAKADDPAHALTPSDTAAMIAGALESAAAALRAMAQEIKL
jgi:hypothetical protein